MESGCTRAKCQRFCKKSILFGLIAHFLKKPNAILELDEPVLFIRSDTKRFLTKNRVTRGKSTAVIVPNGTKKISYISSINKNGFRKITQYWSRQYSKRVLISDGAALTVPPIIPEKISSMGTCKGNSVLKELQSGWYK